MWRNSQVPCIEYDPMEHGWKLGENIDYRIKLFYFYGAEAKTGGGPKTMFLSENDIQISNIVRIDRRKYYSRRC